MLLSRASVNMMEQFDITPDPKTQAVVGLIVAAATVYGPRAVAYRFRKAQEKAEETPGTAGVYNADGTAAGTTTFTAPPVAA